MAIYDEMRNNILNILMLCNTSYQLLVTMWIKYKYLVNDKVDVIISDHFKDSYKLVSSVEETKLFRNVYYAETLDVKNNKVRFSKWENAYHMIFPKRYADTIVRTASKYDGFFTANFDSFSQIMNNALFHENRNIKLYIYEEGLSTYSSFERYYNENQMYYGVSNNIIGKILNHFFYRPHTLFGNVESFYMFNPELMQWDPGCSFFQMEKISSCDENFRILVNKAFDYREELNEFDTEYIFFEESFLAEGTEINDLELVGQIADLVGKDNITIKIHPRNPVNRFEKMGYKTNKYTYIPWEVLLMNMEDLSSKKFITVASACILNPLLTFNRSVHAYSLYNCINRIPPILQDGLWDFVCKIYGMHSELICICNSVEDIIADKTSEEQ